MNAGFCSVRGLARTIKVMVPALALIAASGSVRAELLQPTPLILKDGRIASVSVHVLPFTGEQTALDDAANRTLLRLTRAVATDCFLTAQVIGHVGDAEVRSNDTLTAHRMARSRADAVQAALIESGLPAKSIASVWDWQFMVLEPRATLWVFELTRGEDCEGTPLDGEALVAANQAGAPGAANTPSVTAQASGRSAGAAGAASAGGSLAGAAETVGTGAAAAEAAPSTAAPDEVAQSAGIDQPGRAPSNRSSGATAATTSGTQDPLPLAAAAERAPDEDAGGSAAVEARPAVAAVSRPAAVERSTAQPRPTRRVARAAPSAPAAEAADQRSLPIVFANNSSYFPPGTRQQLESLVKSLGSDGRYTVELVASVSGSASVVGASSPDEAARYNKWLATRRIERVQSWLEVNAKDKDLVIEQRLTPDDDSRRVLVRVSSASTS